MLTSYLTQTQNLLQSPAAPTTLYSTANLTTFINSARLQLAGESQSIRVLATLPLTSGVQVVPFSSITTGTAGVGGVFAVRQALVGIGSGQILLYPRSFEWFTRYYLNQVVPKSALPETWAQYADGTAGSLYFYPIPNAAYTVQLDCVCEPIPLVDDTTVEAIPYPWQDAVPYYAAYLALMSAQRTADAGAMMQIYEMFVKRGRTISTPGVLPTNRPQVPDPTMANKLGSSAPQGGGGQ